MSRSFKVKTSFACLVAVTLVLAITPSSSAQTKENYLIIADEGLDSHANEIRSVGGEIVNRLGNIDTLVARMSPQAAEQLSRIFAPKGTLIEKETFFYPSETQATPSFYWNLDRIDERQRGSRAGYTYENSRSGEGIDAYVIDTGIRLSHTEFEGRARELWRGSRAGATGSDCDGHGTHVAGTIGGKNSGVAKKVNLVAVAPFDCARKLFSSTDLATGVDRIVGAHDSSRRRAVANMSLGGGASSTLDALVDKMHNDGIVVVVAAGNSNANACNYSPARAANAITVGATASNDTRADFSNFGSCVDLFAPGVSIYSSWPSNDSSFATLQGTSMASPLVAGIAARVLSKFPTISATEVANQISNSATLNLVGSPGAGSPNRLSFISPEVLLTQPSAVSDLSAVATSNTNGSVDLQWNLPTSSAGVITPLYRLLIDYSTSNSFTNMSTVEQLTSTTSARVTGLNGGIAYYFRVRLIDDEGRVSSSTVASATPTANTGSIPPSGSTSLSPLTNITGSSFVANWSYAAAGGAATGFTIQYATNSNFTKQVVTLNVDGSSTTTRVISGLRARTTYWVRVRAVNTSGVSSWSNIQSATTLR